MAWEYETFVPDGQCQLFGVNIFATDSQLETARRSGLIEQINSYHREQLIKRHYPIEGIKDCTFASQEECDREFGGNWYYYFK